jgi:hypothetical protein
MLRVLVLAGFVLAACSAFGENWEVTAEQVCRPDFRPAKDQFVLNGAAFDAVDEGELTIAFDEDGDGFGDLLLRLQPEDALQLGLLRELFAEASHFERFGWGRAAPSIRLGLTGEGPRAEVWLVLRTTDCPLPDEWVGGRDLVMLSSMSWSRTSDGPQLSIDDAPPPVQMIEALANYGRPAPERCQAGGPGALSCSLSFGNGGCFAGCARSDQYACCTPTICGCEPLPSSD